MVQENPPTEIRTLRLIGTDRLRVCKSDAQRLERLGIRINAIKTESKLQDALSSLPKPSFEECMLADLDDIFAGADVGEVSRARKWLEDHAKGEQKTAGTDIAKMKIFFVNWHESAKCPPGSLALSNGRGLCEVIDARDFNRRIAWRTAGAEPWEEQYCWVPVQELRALDGREAFLTRAK